MAKSFGTIREQFFPLLDLAWQEKAACQGQRDLFFAPDDGTDVHRAVRERKAKAVCGFCPVQLECLVHALRKPELYGVWGGTVERERKRLRRQIKARREQQHERSTQTAGGDAR